MRHIRSVTEDGYGPCLSKGRWNPTQDGAKPRGIVLSNHYSMGRNRLAFSSYIHGLIFSKVSYGTYPSLAT